jgi:hypothetical protein
VTTASRDDAPPEAARRNAAISTSPPATIATSGAFRSVARTLAVPTVPSDATATAFSWNSVPPVSGVVQTTV